MKQYKPKPKPCYCAAYPFPHRIDSKACRELYNESKVEPITDYYDEYAIRGLFAPQNYIPLS